jgi:pre-mRNA-splicing factor ATP-dependent RNA helicase DHX16
LKPEYLVEAAPHYYKRDEIENLGVERKMPKGEGAPASKF